MSATPPTNNVQQQQQQRPPLQQGGAPPQMRPPGQQGGPPPQMMQRPPGQQIPPGGAPMQQRPPPLQQPGGAPPQGGMRPSPTQISPGVGRGNPNPSPSTPSPTTQNPTTTPNTGAPPSRPTTASMGGGAPQMMQGGAGRAAPPQMNPIPIGRGNAIGMGTPSRPGSARGRGVPGTPSAGNPNAGSGGPPPSVRASQQGNPSGLGFNPNVKTIWQTIQERQKASMMNKEANEDNLTQHELIETTVLLMGHEKSGKTTIMNKVLRRAAAAGDSKEEPKSTVALEYTFAKKEDNFKTYICNVWELAHGRKMTSLLDDLIQIDNINNMTAVIVLDLSKPNLVLQDLQFFFARLKDIATRIFKQMQTSGNNATPPGGAGNVDQYTRFLMKLRRKYFDKHPDAEKVQLSGIQTLVVADKFDLFAKEDPMKQKIMSVTLRQLCHLNGASLVYYSNAAPTSKAAPGGSAPVMDEEMDRQDKCLKAWIGHYMFNAPLIPAYSPSNNSAQQDYLKPLRILAGKDSLDAIVKSFGQETADKYEMLFHNYFGRVSQKTEEESSIEEFAKVLQEYAEPIVDTVRSEKDEELDRYRKMLEKQKQERMAAAQQQQLQQQIKK